jgi:23S rRNA (guanosine2251-2'-O)-methyltransferase
MKTIPTQQIIIGQHSIKAALYNSKRKCLDFYATDDGLKAFLKYHKISKQDVSNKVNAIHVVDPHQFQQVALKYYRDLGFEFQKITSGVFLIAKPLPEISWQDLLKISKDKKIVALDHVTDVHNAAAIIRTCAFYGIGALIVEMKGSFSLSPGLVRIASGGLESVSIFSTNNLPATLKSLKQQGITVLGLSEEAKNSTIPDTVKDKSAQICLVFGSEDKGLSNAVERELDNHLAIPAATGASIESLNVSVAVAVCLERLR